MPRKKKSPPPVGRISELPRRDFLSVIRYIRRSKHEEAIAFRNATFNALKRLGAPRRTDLLYGGKTPAGSDQADPQSLFRWMERLTPADSKALEQLQILDAEAVLRTR